MGGASFEAVAGRLGVGAIGFFGCFLIADGLLNVFPLIEEIGRSVTWGIIGVLPTIVVSYVVGVICSELADIVLYRFASFEPPPLEDAIVVSKIGSVLLSQIYSEQLRSHALLKGSSVSFVLLAVGCLAESRSMGGFTSPVLLFTASAAGLAALSLFFSARANRHTREIGDAARAELASLKHSGLAAAAAIS
jgi:hypothetical protein